MALDTDYGDFLPTTNIFDQSVIESLDINSREFKEFLVRLYQTTNNIALSVNNKDTGLYGQKEFACGQLWFENPSLSSTTSSAPEYRPVFRTVVNFGALKNAAGNSQIAHGITVNANTTFTRIYGVASNTAGSIYRPIPYATTTANEIIEVWIDSTYVNITVGKDQSAYTTCYVVLEYIKQ